MQRFLLRPGVRNNQYRRFHPPQRKVQLCCENALKIYVQAIATANSQIGVGTPSSKGDQTQKPLVRSPRPVPKRGRVQLARAKL
jgi:hypothetical protein